MLAFFFEGLSKMRSLTAAWCVSLCALATVVAVGCEGDDSTGTGVDDGGAPSEAGSPGKAGTTSGGGTKNGGGGEPSEGGSTGTPMGGDGGTAVAGGAGETGIAGEAGMSGGAGGGSPGPGNTCEDFPVTVTMGETIGIGSTGALICLDPCRITSNTFSDGADACPNEAGQVRFFTDAGQSVSNRANMPSGWEWDSASAGTINESFTYVLENIPSETTVTAVLISAEQVEYTVVFSFSGDGQLTVTSFTET